MKEFLILLFHFDSQKLFIEPTKNTFVQFFRFTFVGIIATCFDIGTVAVLREIFNMMNEIAISGGFIVGLIVNYILSVRWVFNRKKTNRIKEFTIFAIIGIIGFFLNLAIVFMIFGKLFDLNIIIINFEFMKIPLLYLVKLIAILITFIWNFTARKYILYNKN